jgi:hypothetical protein
LGGPSFPSVGVVWWRREAAGSVSICAAGPGSPFPSRAHGVGHIFTCTVSDVAVLRPIASFIAMCASGDFWSSRATGVPHIRTARSVSVPVQPSSSASGLLPDDFASSCRPSCVDLIPLPAIPSCALGVSQQPDPFASVRCANGGRREQTPFRIEPEVGKLGEDVRQPESNKLGDVLQEDEGRSHVSDDPGDVGPEPSLVIDTSTLPGLREGLAGEAGSDEIHASTPRSSVERDEVRPDRRLIQVRVVHPRHESGRCVGVPLNVSHGSGVDAGESQSELEPSVAGAEMQGT